MHFFLSQIIQHTIQKMISYSSQHRHGNVHILDENMIP